MYLNAFTLFANIHFIIYSTLFSTHIFCLFLGKDCFDMFKSMQTCMQKYPTLYSKDLSEDDDMAEAIEASEKEAAKLKASEPSEGKNSSKP